MMPRNKSATAPSAAPETRRTNPAADEHSASVLIEAIKNSTTGKDQIVLRRIGLHEEPPRKLT